MATVTQAQLTCDVCGDTNDVKTRTFGLDGQAYEIDLCRKDGNALVRVAARYEDLARDGEGRIDVQMLGSMAAYDFAETAQPES